MKLSKAIEIVDNHQADLPRHEVPDLIAAIKLLIEAGKRISECRLADNMIAEDYLPGETQD